MGCGSSLHQQHELVDQQYTDDADPLQLRPPQLATISSHTAPCTPRHQPLSVRGWLDGICAGWSARFAAPFEDLNVESVSDLPLALQREQLLRETLSIVGAKPFQIENIITSARTLQKQLRLTDGTGEQPQIQSTPRLQEQLLRYTSFIVHHHAAAEEALLAQREIEEQMDGAAVFVPPHQQQLCTEQLMSSKSLVLLLSPLVLLQPQCLLQIHTAVTVPIAAAASACTDHRWAQGRIPVVIVQLEEDFGVAAACGLFEEFEWQVQASQLPAVRC